MADLSPAALSVWCRFCEVVEEHGPSRLGLAAALRAAVDQVGQVPVDLGSTEWEKGFSEGVRLTYRELYAIAVELESQ